MRKRSIVVIALVWMVILVAGVSSAITMAVCGNLPAVGAQRETQAEATPSPRTAWRYKRLDEVREQLAQNYYKELDEEELMLGAVRGMLGAADDPYTFYYTTEEMQAMSQKSLGKYDGVGLLISNDKDGNVRVLRVFEGSPAYEAGVQAGDRIVAVNDTEVSGAPQQKLDEAIDLIRDAEGPLVTLEILRAGKRVKLGMGRSSIQIQRVEHCLLEDGVGYIAIYEFVGDEVSGFHKAVEEFKAQGVSKVIIDLRSNPGGMLEDVVQIADSLMGEGLIVYTLDRYGRREEFFSDKDYWDAEIAVLVNGMSASASEILAGALQDAKRAVIVGEKTFGKGIVQTVLTFPEDGAGMQLTTARYYTPAGRFIHGVGITPDVEVALEGEADIISNEADIASDNQLRAAYEALTR